METITSEEARESLAAVRQISAHMRRDIATGGAPYFTIIWGVVWLVGFLVSQFAPPAVSGPTWAGLDLLGGVATFLTGRRLGMRVRTRWSVRLGLFWLALVGYGALWVWVSLPLSANQGALLISLIAMFGYVVMGLWLDSRIAYIGLAVTALALFGYHVVPLYFSLWMALLGGGVLIGSGLYILRYWR